MTGILENQDINSENVNANPENENTQAENNGNQIEYASREEIVSRIKELMHSPITEIKDEIEVLKQSYYKILKQENEVIRQEYLTKHGSLEGLVIPNDNTDDDFKQLIDVYKMLKTKFNEEQDNLKTENLKRKNDILNRMTIIIRDSENVEKHYNEFVDLSKEFKEIKNIPVADVTLLWKKYQVLLENFYDLLKINRELRDYDFKKNLDKKEYLC